MGLLHGGVCTSGAPLAARLAPSLPWGFRHVRSLLPSPRAPVLSLLMCSLSLGSWNEERQVPPGHRPRCTSSKKEMGETVAGYTGNPKSSCFFFPLFIFQNKF